MAKLETAGRKGVPETSLLGKGVTEAKRTALKALERDGHMVRKAGTSAIFCFSAACPPVPAFEALSELVEQVAAEKGPTLWKIADFKAALSKLKFYTLTEAEHAVRALCQGKEMLAVNDGKTTKYLSRRSLGDSVPASGRHGDDYFVSHQARLIYALVELEGEGRQRALGLTPAHYRSPEMARQWRNDVAKLIHPDVCHHPKAHAAADELENVYREMTG